MNRQRKSETLLETSNHHAYVSRKELITDSMSTFHTLSFHTAAPLKVLASAWSPPTVQASISPEENW
jgi:hypothetical protein